MGIWLDIADATNALQAERERRTEQFGDWRTYCKSDRWLARKKDWYQEEYRRLGMDAESEPYLLCPLCGTYTIDAHHDLHHVTYERVPNEDHDDLRSVCWRCHKRFERFVTQTDAVDWELVGDLPAGLPDPRKQPGLFLLRIWPNIELKG